MSENEKKDINYTRNDGAKYRYSAPPGRKSSSGKAAEAPKKVKKTVEAVTKKDILWKTNRALAIAILVAVIILSSFLSCYRAVARSAKAVEKCYAAETDLKESVSGMLKEADRLASLCEAKYEGTDTSKLRNAVKELRNAGEKPFWGDDLPENVLQEAQKVFFKINNDSSAKEINEKIESYYNSLATSSEYREAAEKYNKTISKFPTNIFGKKSVPVFKTVEKTPEQDESVEQSLGSLISDGIEKLSTIQILGIIAGVILAIFFIVKRVKK